MTWPPGPIQFVPTGRRNSSQSLSIGAKPRQAMRPVNCAFGELNIWARSWEWTPSAPTSTSPGHRLAVLQQQFDRAACLPKAGAARIHVNGFGLQFSDGVEKHAVQIAAMDHPIGRTETFDRILAEVEKLARLSGIPDPHFLGRRLANQRPQSLFELEGNQDARSVGGDLNAGAHFAQLGRLFVDVDIESALQKGKRRGQAADAGASDDHVRSGLQGGSSRFAIGNWSSEGR